MSEYLTELHSHTKESSSCSAVSAKNLIDLYKSKSYSTIVITDHCSKSNLKLWTNQNWRKRVDRVCQGFNIAKEYGDKLKINVLFGVEITLKTTDSDYLIYGLDRSFLDENESIYLYTLEKLFNLVKTKGGALVQAHPFRKNIQLAPLKFIDGIEVFNGCQDENSRNNKAVKYGKETNKILTSGSDFHQVYDVDKGGIKTEKEIKNNEQLIRIFKTNNFSLA